MAVAQKSKSSAKVKKKAKRVVADALVSIHASFNNTIISFSDRQGNVLCWASTGMVGFKGSRKGTPFAAQAAAEQAGKQAQDEFAVKRVWITVRGPGARESAIKSLMALGFEIVEIIDGTGIPHNGCRPRKKRRV